MAEAEVGDDVFGDDPTVIKLETFISNFFCKEAAVFVPTGTMGNLISLMAHTWERGSEYIVGDQAHIYMWEQGGAAQFGGAHPRVLQNQKDGTLLLADLSDAIRHDDIHFPITKVLCIEDTFKGHVLPLDYIDACGQLARNRGIALHMDGARIWNAIVASGVEGRRRVEHVDSLSVCLSKGLGVPAGSVIVGSAEFVARCRRLRKGLGGGMRQIGVLAAAGLYALEHHFPRVFAADHRTAQQLAAGLAAMPGIRVSVQTNMVFIDVASSKLTAPELECALAVDGVLCCALSEIEIRLVTNLGVNSGAIDRVLAIFNRKL